MKTYVKYMLLVLVAAAGVLTGCGNKDDNKTQSCNAAGYCGPAGGGYWGPGSGGYYNKNAVVLAGGLTVTDQNAWNNAIQGLTGCQGPWDIEEMCTLINNAAPRLEVVFDDYKFTNGQSTGQLVIGSQEIGGMAYRVTWLAINENTGFDTQLLLPYEFDGRFLRVEITGRSTDSRVAVKMFYGSKMVGTGQLNRVNTGGSQPVYPTPY